MALGVQEPFRQQLYADAAAAALEVAQRMQTHPEEDDQVDDDRKRSHMVMSSQGQPQPQQRTEGDQNKDNGCRNQTGFIGVRQRKWGMFAAEIRDGDKRRWLGSFNTGREAGMAYDSAAISQKGCKAKTNFRYGDFSSLPRAGAEEVDAVRWDLLPKDIAEKFPIPSNPQGNGARDGDGVELAIPRARPSNKRPDAAKEPEPEDEEEAYEEAAQKRGRGAGGYAIDPFGPRFQRPSSYAAGHPGHAQHADEDVDEEFHANADAEAKAYAGYQMASQAATASFRAAAAANYASHANYAYPSMYPAEAYDPAVYGGQYGMMDAMYDDASAMVVPGPESAGHKKKPGGGGSGPAAGHAEAARGAPGASKGSNSSRNPAPQSAMYDYMNHPHYAYAGMPKAASGYMMAGHGYGSRFAGNEGSKRGSPAPYSPGGGMGQRPGSEVGGSGRPGRSRTTDESLPAAGMRPAAGMDRSPAPGADGPGALGQYPSSGYPSYEHHLMQAGYNHAMYPNQYNLPPASAAPAHSSHGALQASYTTTPGPTTGAVVRPRAVHLKDFTTTGGPEGMMGGYSGAFQPYQPSMGYHTYLEQYSAGMAARFNHDDDDDEDGTGTEGAPEERHLIQRWKDMASSANYAPEAAAGPALSMAGNGVPAAGSHMNAHHASKSLHPRMAQEGAAAIVAAAAAAAQRQQRREGGGR